MSLFWVKQGEIAPARAAADWATVELVEDRYFLDLNAWPDALRLGITEPGRWATLRRGAALVRCADNVQPSEAGWLLLTTDSELRVNGLPVSGGAIVLRDRDEVFTPSGHRAYFSSEQLATVEDFSGNQSEPCAICRMPIEPGTPAVRCAGCGIAHHQSTELPCWLHGEACSICKTPTNLNAGFTWTPQVLEGSGQ